MQQVHVVENVVQYLMCANEHSLAQLILKKRVGIEQQVLPIGGGHRDTLCHHRGVIAGTFTLRLREHLEPNMPKARRGPRHHGSRVSPLALVLCCQFLRSNRARNTIRCGVAQSIWRLWH